MISFSLSNKVALVTGSSRGLGYGIAKSLGKAGAKVVINYLNDRESGENALENLRNEGIHSMLVRADVSDPEQIKSLVEAVEEKFEEIADDIEEAVEKALDKIPSDDELKKLTKAKLDDLAKSLGIKLDRRKSKDNMIIELKDKAGK